MQNKDVPFDRSVIDEILHQLQADPGTATIRKMSQVVGEVEKKLSCRFLRMEFGIPGIEPIPLGIEAEISALRKPKVAGAYPPLLGVPLLKEQASIFLKKYLNLEIPSEFIVPTVGSMQGLFLALAVAGRSKPGKNKVLFIDPNFAVYRIQTRFLGLKEISVDLFDRESFLHQAEAACQTGDVAAMVYSSPNNPTWSILTEKELESLGNLCAQHDIIAIEDDAYFGMDFRADYSIPDQPPFPPTIARYTKNFLLLLSSSKIFSYAGQRLGLAIFSPELAQREFPSLEENFGNTRFFDAYVWNALYGTTAGAPHSTQYALATLFSKANRGEYNFLQNASIYGQRAKFLRKILRSHGFQEVYQRDGEVPIADGFFFTFSYPGFSGESLVRELLYYGISTTSLRISGSTRTEGVRGCSALIGENDFQLFESRIKAFGKDHPISS